MARTTVALIFLLLQISNFSNPGEDDYLIDNKWGKTVNRFLESQVKQESGYQIGRPEIAYAFSDVDLLATFLGADFRFLGVVVVVARLFRVVDALVREP